MSSGATGRQRSSSGGTRTRLPVSGYDEMPLYQIREEAYGLSPAELDVLRSYEEQHEGRDTLLRTFDTLQDGGARGREPATSSRSGTSRTTSSRGGSATRGASTREGSGRAGSSKRTTDHDLIRGWAEEHGGKPVSVRGTGRGGEAALACPPAPADHVCAPNDTRSLTTTKGSVEQAAPPSHVDLRGQPSQAVNSALRTGWSH